MADDTSTDNTSTPAPTIESPQVSDEDKRRFTVHLTARLKDMKDDGERSWYLALICAALDEHVGDVNNAFKVADRVFQQGPKPSVEG